MEIQLDDLFVVDLSFQPASPEATQVPSGPEEPEPISTHDAPTAGTAAAPSDTEVGDVTKIQLERSASPPALEAARAQSPAAGAGAIAADAEVASLLAFSQQALSEKDASTPSFANLPPMPQPSVQPSSQRHHPYGSVLSDPGSHDTIDPSASQAGPLRTRRGQATSDLSLALGANSNLNAIPFSPRIIVQEDSTETVEATIGRTTSPTASPPQNGERVIKMGDHAFKIPLSSPKIAPQLQANVRLTSTGRPSHARKVPEGHVKRPRNAFILFRSYACTSNLLPATLGINDHRQVSRIVGQLWKGLKPEEKAIWEKKAHEEKEAHKANNPDYRYKPVYRGQAVSKRKRKKPQDEDEAEEEDRKCEVVARVLLEGREVDEKQLQEEVKKQKIKDQEEGRDRSRSRSRSRSKSAIPQLADDQYQNRHVSAPPGADLYAMDMASITDDGFLRPSNAPRSMNTRSRAKTMPSTYDGGITMAPLYNGQGQIPPEYTLGFQGRYGSISNGLAAPSPRTTANMQQLFEALHGDELNPPAVTPFTNYSSGFKPGTENLSLISPSYSRKFSLGRWEIPAAPREGQYDPPSNVAVPGAYGDFSNAGASMNPASAIGQPNYTYDTASANPAGAPYQEAPTYVYLSKADAQNPEIVNHYLSQGYGVSYDA